MAVSGRSRRRWTVPHAAARGAHGGRLGDVAGPPRRVVLDDERAIVRNQTIRSVWPLGGPLSPPSQSTWRVGRRQSLVRAELTPWVRRAPRRAGRQCRARRRPSTPRHSMPVTSSSILPQRSRCSGLVRRTLMRPAAARPLCRRGPWIAFAVALLWVVHPLQTSAVTYIVQRVESLMGSSTCLNALLRRPGLRRGSGGMVERRGSRKLRGGHGDEGKRW